MRIILSQDNITSAIRILISSGMLLIDIGHDASWAPNAKAGAAATKVCSIKIAPVSCKFNNAKNELVFCGLS